MSSDRQVLVVDSATGAFSSVMEELDELGFRVIWVPTLEAGLEFLRATPRLSLIVASAAATRVGGLDFLVQVKEIAPDVRIIWGVLPDQPGGAEPRCQRQGHGPDSLIPEPIRSDELRSAISELLAEHFYPAPIADAIKAAALEVFGNLGDVKVDGAAFLVANRSALSEVSAVIAFAGDVAGHLNVGMTREHATILYGALVPGMRPARIEHIEDLVGELCNQILGRINAFFALHAVSVHHGTPIFVRAPGSTLRYPGRHPSFGVTLVKGEALVCLEYYLSDFDRSKLRAPVAARALALGEVRYL